MLDAVMRALAAVLLVFCPFYVHLASAPEAFPPCLGVLALLGVAAWLNRHHRTHAAALLVCASLYGLVTATTLASGGVQSPAYGAYAVGIIVAGLVLGGRAAIGFTLLSVTTGAAMVLLSRSRLRDLPLDFASPGSDAAAAWASSNAYLVVAALLLFLADRATRDTLSRLREARRALRESDERYAMAVRGSNDGLWDWDLDNDAIYVSPRWLEMLGLSPRTGDVTPSTWLGRICPDDLPAFREAFDAHLADETVQFESEHRLRHADGGWRWVLVRGLAVRDEAGVPRRIAGSLADISPRKMAEQALAHAARHDALTSLPNRALFLEELQEAVAQARQRGMATYALLFIDLDRFKAINDSLGHQVGDGLLTAFAGRLRGCIGGSDTAARLGGDEFAVIVRGVPERARIDAVAERIRTRLAERFVVHGREVRVTCSIGVAFGSVDYSDADAVVRDADIAMYRAKSLGKDRCEPFEFELREEVLRRRELEEDLRASLENGGLDVVYQPTVEATTGALGSFEALVRWNHPTRGPLSPSEFMDVAEETGLVVELDRFVLRRAVAEACAWRAERRSAAAIGLSVNVSKSQFQRADFAEFVVATLRRTGLPAHCLDLEFGEAVLMSDCTYTRANLALLREAGVRLALDDFGTGYSSLGALHRARVDVLKIDRSFVHAMERDVAADLMVRTIVSAARGMDLRVVAEGVESLAQSRALARLGCHQLQGRLFSDVLSADQVSRLVADWPRFLLRDGIRAA
ncbi:MAG: EAL domain-containing protein [Deltaproteobacteria bacterium]|nr:EAL domain-containing protein [Deltaproteobacteria bacterium]MCB9788774.1 EAL domain-containing protein [Deltaproteobacteria bacterium]